MFVVVVTNKQFAFPLPFYGVHMKFVLVGAYAVCNLLTSSLTPRIFIDARLEHLSSIMPGHGRIAYDYMPEEVKQEVGAIADWIMTQPDFVKAKEQYMQANLDIVNMYMRDQPEEIKQAMDRAYNDLRKRIAQDILKAAVQYPNEREPPQPELAHDFPQEEEIPVLL